MSLLEFHIFDKEERNSSCDIDGLSSLLGHSYNNMYLPNMKECVLMMVCPINIKDGEGIIVALQWDDPTF